MRIFKTKEFARFARRERISDANLEAAVARAEAGHIDADLGGGIVKQRVPRAGQGRSGGYRVIVFYRTRTRAIFVEGYAKSARDNIEADELVALRKACRLALAFTDEKIAALLEARTWLEIDNGAD